jgi:hypothetical protein
MHGWLAGMDEPVQVALDCTLEPVILPVVDILGIPSAVDASDRLSICGALVRTSNSGFSISLV